MMILATFDCNIDDKVLAVTLDEYSILSCVDMNWFLKHLQWSCTYIELFRRMKTLAVPDNIPTVLGLDVHRKDI